LSKDEDNQASKEPIAESAKPGPADYDSLSLESMQFMLGLIKSGKLKLDTPDYEQHPKQDDPDADT
jgi:hypothetical protein